MTLYSRFTMIFIVCFLSVQNDAMRIGVNNPTAVKKPEGSSASEPYDRSPASNVPEPSSSSSEGRDEAIAADDVSDTQSSTPTVFLGCHAPKWLNDIDAENKNEPTKQSINQPWIYQNKQGREQGRGDLVHLKPETKIQAPSHPQTYTILDSNSNNPCRSPER